MSTEVWIKAVFWFSGDSYISELFEYGIHLKFGRFTVVDAESFVFLIVFLVHFLQRKWKKKMLKKQKTIFPPHKFQYILSKYKLYLSN